MFGHQQRGDQVARQDEEHVHTEEPTGKDPVVKVVDQNGRDRYGPKAVQ
ncbi:MAG: hypothetical protein M5U19_02195 [Microthrixaceae bacterium]|nr:hypothetical protein [Microthrixaceae bacterium]